MNLQKVVVNGVKLHYAEHGYGTPVVLVHGGLADYREWEPHLERFAQHYRVITYSRRYNYPNQNPAVQLDHSALVEAADLAALLQHLGLDQVAIVGYSYGAFVALCLALEHPALVRTLVLAEPPVHRWASRRPGGDAVLAEFMQTLWEPVGQAFRRGDPELALRLTANVFVGDGGFDRLPTEARQIWTDNLREWEALTTSADAFPLIAPERVAQLRIPTLMLAAEQTLIIHRLVNDELERLLPLGQRVTIPGATHDMWAEQPEACGAATLQFLKAHA